MQGALGDGDLLLIRIAPDHEGKFGFNVKVSLFHILSVCLTHHTGLGLFIFYLHTICLCCHSSTVAPFNFPKSP